MLLLSTVILVYGNQLLINRANTEKDLYHWAGMDSITSLESMQCARLNLFSAFSLLLQWVTLFPAMQKTHVLFHRIINGFASASTIAKSPPPNQTTEKKLRYKQKMVIEQMNEKKKTQNVNSHPGSMRIKWMNSYFVGCWVQWRAFHIHSNSIRCSHYNQIAIAMRPL